MDNTRYRQVEEAIAAAYLQAEDDLSTDAAWVELCTAAEAERTQTPGIWMARNLKALHLEAHVDEIWPSDRYNTRERV